jgi:hypothetical protein
MNQPYPNLADVPAAPTPAAPGTQAQITAQAHAGVSAPSPGALAGLSLPDGAPPLPDVPGLGLPAEPSPVSAPAPVAEAAPAVPPPPAPPPVAIGFAPGKALLPFDEGKKIMTLAAVHGTAPADAVMIAGGFGDGSLTLALERARRLAAALTADGVPAEDIRLTASSAGSGGFVQLVY